MNDPPIPAGGKFIISNTSHQVDEKKCNRKVEAFFRLLDDYS